MVNTGKPSGGCYTCRARRVKCDEQRPCCQRCINLNRECGGYRDGAVFAFKDQNRWAKEKVKDRVSSKRKAASTTSSASSSSSSSSTSSSTSTTSFWDTDEGFPSRSTPESGDFGIYDELIILPKVNVTPEVHAINHFFAQYATGSTAPDKDLYFLPKVIASRNVTLSLAHAVPAVALMSMSQQMKQPGMAALARQHYGKALSALGRAIQDPKEAKSDPVYAAVLMVSLYENMTSDNADITQIDPHHRGRTALLRLRGKEQIETKLGLSLFGLAHVHAIMDSLLHFVEPIEDSLDWFTTGPHCGHPMVYAMKRIYGLARYRIQLHKLLRDSSLDTNLILDKVREGVKIEEGFEEHNMGIDAGFLPRLFPNPIKPTHKDEWTPSYVHVYDHLSSAGFWNTLRTGRIHLLESLLLAVREAERTPFLSKGFPTAKWKALVRVLVDDICASVAFALGEIDAEGNRTTKDIQGAMSGYSLMWPLRICLLAEGVPPEQRAWIASKLRKLHNSLGIAKAGIIADMYSSQKLAKPHNNSPDNNLFDDLGYVDGGASSNRFCGRLAFRAQG